jgi:urease accessory protein
VTEDPDGAIVLTGFTPLIEVAAMRHARADLRLFAN